MAWTSVQGIQEKTGSGTSASAIFGSAIGANHVVLGYVFITPANAANPITSISDGTNTYSVIDYDNDAGGGFAHATFWSGGRIAAGPTTITVNTGSFSTTNLWIDIEEFAPPAGTVALDGHAITHVNSATPTSPSITTTQNGDLIFGAVVDNGGTSAGSGFTILQGNGGNFATEFQNQTSAGSISASFTQSGAAESGVAVVALSAVVTSIETNTFSPPPRFYPPQWNSDRRLFRTTAQDLSSLGVETNPHWQGRIYPLQWSVNRALYQNPAVDILPVLGDSPIHYSPRKFPLLWSINWALYQTTAQDFSSFGVETNPHWSAKTWPVSWKLSATLWQTPATDVPSVQLDTPVYFCPRTFLPQWVPQKSLMQSTAQNFSSLGVETNTFFKPWTWPIQWKLNASLMRGFPQDFTTLPPATQPVYARYGASHGIGTLSAIPGEIPS